MDNNQQSTEDSAELACVVEASPEVLAELLQLPRGCYIDSVTAPIDSMGTLQLRLRGAGWRTKPGMRLMRAVGTVERRRDEAGNVVGHVIDWGLPSHPVPARFNSTEN